MLHILVSILLGFPYTLHINSVACLLRRYILCLFNKLSKFSIFWPTFVCYHGEILVHLRKRLKRFYKMSPTKPDFLECFLW
ncbi:hypothetical protein GDO81_001540 [Engystomops pustulosus]|uniref:Uncharacterized protein n=1 Tax=Engystomops pustulosus TaxID=76066 RepID=A0AAV7DEC3_ENGPU|nr:hypothetical protein GDO81_001540 [Engystomops pustulosus]